MIKKIWKNLEIFSFLVVVVLLILIGTFFGGCSVKQATVSAPGYQKAILYDGKKQIDIVNRSIKAVFSKQKYQYDSEVYGGDNWNPDLIFDILKNVHKYVYGDCEDTMFAHRMYLFLNGFPADQMYYSFCLVPSQTATVTGVKTDWGGHAVLIAEVEGYKPITLEQRPKWLYLLTLIKDYGYYFVATKRTDTDMLKNKFKYIDYKSYMLFVRGFVKDAMQSPGYRAFVRYSNTAYHRKDYEENK